MKRYLILLLMTLCALPGFAQADKHDVRAGNRKFSKGNFKEAEIDYRKAVVKDSTSLHAQYNLASALYRQQDYDGAAKALESVIKTCLDDIAVLFQFRDGIPEFVHGFFLHGNGKNHLLRRHGRIALPLHEGHDLIFQ